jgi:CubicO group peptidase (beta-lactamase class C family)
VDGSIHPDFYPVAECLRQILGEYGGGGAVCVYHHGECVADLWGGVRDELATPWTRDTMAPSFSTTKGVASTLVHIMVDRGLLDYDDRVAAHWPEFAQAGKERITVRQVLSHQSGLYHIRQMIDHADRMRDWRHMIRAIEQARPIHPPGTRTGYHGLTYGFLVGEILQRVTGKSFSRLVREELAQPLDLDGMYIGAPREELARAAQLMWAERILFGPQLMALEGTVRGDLVLRGADLVRWLLALVGVEFDLRSVIDALAPRGINAFDFGSEETLLAAIPAANGLFTARSLAKLYAALAGGGEIDGVRLLSARTLARATRPQGGAQSRVVIPWDMRWRLGYHGVATTRGVPRRAFGHFGFGGSGAWADPKRNLAVALIVNAGMGTPFGDLRILRIGGAALACADVRPRIQRPAPRLPEACTPLQQRA